MATAPKPETVDDFLTAGCGRCSKGGTDQCKVVPWQGLLSLLREQILQSGLAEQIKWGSPCYTFENKNVLMLSALKDSVVISFFAGAKLADDKNLLEKPGENSRFARYLRFTEVSQVRPRSKDIAQFISQAIALTQQADVNDNANETSAADLPEYPEELVQAFEIDPDYQEAFAALTQGRKRGYLLHFSGAKQAKTRVSRIAKARDKVFSGKGFNEY